MLPAKLKEIEDKLEDVDKIKVRVEKMETDAKGFMTQRVATASQQSKDIDDLQKNYTDLKTRVDNIDVTALEQKMQTYINTAVDRVKSDRMSSGLRAVGTAIDKINNDIKTIKLKLNIP